MRGRGFGESLALDCSAPKACDKHMHKSGKQEHGAGARDDDDSISILPKRQRTLQKGEVASKVDHEHRTGALVGGITFIGLDERGLDRGRPEHAWFTMCG